MELTLGITLAVLGAALLHAGWNAMVKSASDKQLDLAGVTLGGALVAVPLLLVVDPPLPASWPFLATSALIHIAYYFAVVGAYRAGDLSHSYPIMRGIAPLLVAMCALAWFGEAPSPATWLGVVMICAGVLSLGLHGLDWAHARGKSTRWAIANAVIIAAYTLVDATGVRLAGSTGGYVLWMFFLDGFPFTLIVLALRRGEFSRYFGKFWTRGVLGGSMSCGAYAIVLWAMTRAPVAAVAALRETSVIFAALIGGYLLNEGEVKRRIAVAVAVAAGVVVLKIG